MAWLASIHLYPVKSLAGLSLETAEIEPWGLAGDRRFMLVDAEGRFFTQRESPSLARIVARPAADGIILSDDAGATLAVAHPGADTQRMAVNVWRDRLSAALAGAEADDWLSARAGRTCRLVYMDAPATARPVDLEFGREGDRVSFADGFPLLLTTEASLDDLAARLGADLPMQRFRPNIVVAGTPAWAEDGWTRVTVGQVSFRVVKDCARCKITTIDPLTGAVSPLNEPLRTLATFRRKAGGRIIFGQNLVPEGPGTIAVGDAVSLA